ncbi:adaptin ear-binding coat-associated protein 1/2 [Entomortierella parvispora]|uniref:Adaptin ear-binding coat-associated protein 1/2 n=1 Tax=Entomortierella parvispora TaxID=205924 RepID=A0A9P3M1D1_9FUNG|nr:adaptin ear-binding coat-associated protein 1/2 [Entomortierella parvispora]
MSNIEDDDYESVLLVIRECYVYKVPPLTSSRGHKAADWGNVDKPLWSGRLRIIAVGKKCFIRLEDGKTGELFASCPYEENKGCVEPVTDSSRYFVVRIEDQGRHAFLGLGFLDRSHAFDFNVALQDHFKHLAAEQKAAEQKKLGTQQPKMDFSLKEGQTINLTIAGGIGSGAGSSQRRTRPARPAVPEQEGALPPLLPPPPPPGKRK